MPKDSSHHGKNVEEDAEILEEGDGFGEVAYGHKAAIIVPPKKKPGRKPGQKNKATLAREELHAHLAADGITPLAYLLKLMRDEEQEQAVRVDCAAKAAPYVHPKLSAIEQNLNIRALHEDALDELE